MAVSAKESAKTAESFCSQALYTANTVFVLFGSPIVQLAITTGYANSGKGFLVCAVVDVSVMLSACFLFSLLQETRQAKDVIAKILFMADRIVTNRLKRHISNNKAAIYL